MSTPYLGEIKMLAFGRVPNGWVACNGQLLLIADYDTLFNLIGTIYGGDGQETFAVPNLAGRMAAHRGPVGQQGQLGGLESLVLTTSQLPAHTHQALASSNYGGVSSPGGNLWSRSTYVQYSSDAAGAQMQADALQPAGQSQPVDNLPPFVVISFVISVSGFYPSQI